MTAVSPDTVPHRFRYSIVPEIFLPSQPGFEPSSYDYISQELGLVTRNYDTGASLPDASGVSQWLRFKNYVDSLNTKAPKDTSYKVLYLGRHGEGVHNVAERTYGRQAWDSYWAKQTGNDAANWVDALLTDKGVEQAVAGNAFWRDELSKGIPAPQTFYSSPLRRCLQTAFLTFRGLDLLDNSSLQVTVKERLRETIGRHHCDRRSDLSDIESFASQLAPDIFVLDPSLDATDILWDAEERETDEDTQARLRHFLDDLFANDPSTWISLTTHSGACRAILAVVGHRLFRIPQGSAMAVLVEAEKTT